MNHSDIRHKLSDYIDNAVSDAEKSEIGSHLAACPECAAAIEELRKAIGHMKEIEEIEPPAWMKQKIMAQVRTEAEKKKSIFQRLFYPFRVKLPIQAVAVVFLAVTAFYIYRNIQPAPAPSEAPVQEFATRQAAPAPSPQTKREEPKIRKDIPSPEKKAPETPEYKSLDMKYEYEKPAAPAPAGKAAAPDMYAPPPPAAALAPLRQKEQTGLQDKDAGRRMLPKAPMGDSGGYEGNMRTESIRPMQRDMAERSASGSSMEKKAKASAPAASIGAMAEAPEPTAVRMTLMASDVAKAVRDAETVVKQLGGQNIKRTEDSGKPVISVQLDSGRANELITRLSSIGELKDKERLFPGLRRLLQVEIVIIQTPPHP